MVMGVISSFGSLSNSGARTIFFSEYFIFEPHFWHKDTKTLDLNWLIGTSIEFLDKHWSSKTPNYDYELGDSISKLLWKGEGSEKKLSISASCKKRSWQNVQIMIVKKLLNRNLISILGGCFIFILQGKKLYSCQDLLLRTTLSCVILIFY